MVPLGTKKDQIFFCAMKGDEVLPPPPSPVVGKNYRPAVKIAVLNPAPAMLSQARLAPAKISINLLTSDRGILLAKLLLVEDDTDLATIVVNALQDAHYNVDLVHNAKDTTLNSELNLSHFY